MIYLEKRLSDVDLSVLRMFQYKHQFFLSQSAFKALSYVFPRESIPSIEQMRTRIRFLSGLNIRSYDCCVNNCCCYLGSFKDDNSCYFCDEPRFTADGKSAQKKYSYTPLIPRLTAMYENKELSKELLYCHEYTTPLADNSTTHDDVIQVADIWDGALYKDLDNGTSRSTEKSCASDISRTCTTLL